jgi:hypothetical protein
MAMPFMATPTKFAFSNASIYLESSNHSLAQPIAEARHGRERLEPRL